MVLARAGRDIGRPELGPDVALAQPRQIGVQTLLGFADIARAKREVALVAELPGQVVVAVDEQGLAMDRKGFVRQLHRLSCFGPGLVRERLGPGNEEEAPPSKDGGQASATKVHRACSEESRAVYP